MITIGMNYLYGKLVMIKIYIESCIRLIDSVVQAGMKIWSKPSYNTDSWTWFILMFTRKIF